ncbi:MAG TPA: DMT family transporter [Trueperaceae bacterium]|nr:DMT family transporter [Trueperaceae bacterium]
MTLSNLTRQGIVLRIVSTVFFAGMAVFVKLASEEAPVGQIVFFRSAFAMIPLVIFLLARREFPAGLATKRPFGHLARSGLGAASMFLSFAAISRLPLADSTLVSYVTPLLTALLGGLLLGEVLTRSKMTGIFLGMCGVLVLTLPQLIGTTIDATRLVGYGLGLLSAVLAAGAMIQVRRLGTTESPGAIALYFVLVSALASLFTLPTGWVAPSTGTLAMLVLAGLVGGLAHIAMTLSYRYAEASTLAPFEYLSLIWAGVLDLTVFQLGLSPWFLLAVPLLITGAAVSTGTLGEMLSRLTKRNVRRRLPGEPPTRKRAA